MATVGGQSSPSLIAVAIRQYARFDVYQLVRILRYRSRGLWPMGSRLRFRADLGAAFPGHEISSLGKAKPLPDFRLAGKDSAELPQRIELRTANYCVASELGPLPEPFLEWVREQQRVVGGDAMAAFLDVFNQRVHVLRHEQKMRSLRALDPELPADSRYASQLSMLMGVGLPSQKMQIPLPMRAWLGLSGMLVNSRKSGAVVARILSTYLGVECRLNTLVGRWRDLEPCDRIALGKTMPGHSPHRLGRSTLLGQRTWDMRAAVSLDISRMHFRDCCALLPLRPAHEADVQPPQAHRGLVGMIRLLLDRRFDCDVSIHIDPGTVPEARLVRSGPAGLGLRLGQTAWIGRHLGRAVRFTVPAYDAGEAA